MVKPFLIALSVLLLLLNFIDVDVNEKLVYDGKEKFDSTLSHLNSINKLENYIDSITNANAIKTTSLDYVVIISNTISNRFYHGFSHFSLKENWLAAFSEKIMGYGLASKVKPDDIMKHENAACSQQAMVMMELLKRKQYAYRSVGFPHHFALEVLVDDKWYYFDPNMEPNISNEQRLEGKWNCCADSLKKYYDTSRFKDLDWKFGQNLKVDHGKVNQSFASNAKLFQNTTSVLSKIMWCFPLLLLFYKSRKSNKQ